ncbi:hypothetical protein QQZ08_009088 [Neonectria magnoliae]|uniref:BHLH domain-containing protein n=1 Tax=Neonectria magnoliae TaxID=2732573 RepID=A0ABR1HRB8_9HYPO
MDPTYLEALGGEGDAQGDDSNNAWMTTMEPASMPYPGLAVSPHAAASPTPLHSPETLSLDHPFYPSPMGDVPYPDQSAFGDFPIGTFAVPPGLFPFRLGHRGSSAAGLSDFTSAPTAGLYSPTAGPYASPTAFLPTPPTADDLSAPEDSSVSSPASPEPKKRKRASAPTTKKRRAPQQLRTASRAPKKRPSILPQRPTETVEDVKARAAHNQVEQQYRKRLNAHFERLLEVLPAPRASAVGGRRDGIGERRVSKAEVLDLATERIQALERDMARLERERRELRARMRGGLLI